jgi:hypothetical protein
VLIEKKVIFRAGTDTKELYLCVAALNKYLSDNIERSTDRERTYNVHNNTKEIYIREREKSIFVRYKKLKAPKERARKDKQLTRETANNTYGEQGCL